MLNMGFKKLRCLLSVSGKSIILDFFQMIVALVGLVAVGYFLLGVTQDIIVDKSAEKFERVINRLIDLDSFETPYYAFDAQKATQELLNEITDSMSENPQSYSVQIYDNSQSNLMVLPGKIILLSSGLMNRLQSENELAFLLANAVYYMQQQTYLISMNRSVVFVYGSALFFGAHSPVTHFVKNHLPWQKERFSRKQIANADNFALKALKKRYGHVAGPRLLLERLQRDLVSTDVYRQVFGDGDVRLADLDDVISEREYLESNTVSLDPRVFRKINF